MQVGHIDLVLVLIYNWIELDILPTLTPNKNQPPRYVQMLQCKIKLLF
jgi:hypothetical protein